MSEAIAFAAPDVHEDDIAAVSRVLRSGWLTTGKECARLEEELASYLDVPHVVATSSCTAALETAYAYLGLPKAARVGVPTWTFVASALAPHRHGARPVLLDVEPSTLNLSVASLEAALVEGLDAVVAVHFGGVAVSKEVHDLCAEAGVPLIEDAAHALGATDHRGLIAGRQSAGAAFSFYATKNLTSAEGGALATEDGQLAAFARVFRLHGLSHEAWKRYEPGGESLYDLETAGTKGNLPDVLAALARSQLARFDAMQFRRCQAVDRYRDNLSAVDGLQVVPPERDGNGADHLMVVLLPHRADRSGVIDRLAEAGIGTSIHFQPIHTLSWFQQPGNAEIGPGGLAVADALAPRVLSLPLHARLSAKDVDRVCEALMVALDE